MQRKKPQLCIVSEKIKKNLQKLPFSAKIAKKTNFSRFFLIFSKTILCKDLRFFALHSVHQDASFELSKLTIGQFFRFFTHRGDPYDLGGVKMYPHHKKMVKTRKLRLFWK